MIKKVILPLAAAAMIFASCDNNGKVGKVSLSSEKDSVSYCIGNSLGQSFAKDGLELNDKVLIKAIRQAMQGEESQLDRTQIRVFMTKFTEKLKKAAAEKAKMEGEKNKKAGEDFLAKNKTKKGVTTTESGLQYEVIKEGNGAKPLATDIVTVSYKGSLIDGTEFDASKPEKPATFPLNGVIKGWTEGVQLMTVGSKYKFYIPSELAYGSRQAGPVIKPNSTLVFEVELLSIKKAEENKK